MFAIRTIRFCLVLPLVVVLRLYGLEENRLREALIEAQEEKNRLRGENDRLKEEYRNFCLSVG